MKTRGDGDRGQLARLLDSIQLARLLLGMSEKAHKDWLSDFDSHKPLRKSLQKLIDDLLAKPQAGEIADVMSVFRQQSRQELEGALEPNQAPFSIQDHLKTLLTSFKNDADMLLLSAVECWLGLLEEILLRLVESPKRAPAHYDPAFDLVKVLLTIRVTQLEIRMERGWVSATARNKTTGQVLIRDIHRLRENGDCKASLNEAVSQCYEILQHQIRPFETDVRCDFKFSRDSSFSSWLIGRTRQILHNDDRRLSTRETHEAPQEHLPDVADPDTGDQDDLNQALYTAWKSLPNPKLKLMALLRYESTLPLILGLPDTGQGFSREAIERYAQLADFSKPLFFRQRLDWAESLTQSQIAGLFGLSDRQIGRDCAQIRESLKSSVALLPFQRVR